MNAFEGRLVVPFEELRMTDVEIVGGKNASLGEMISQLAQTGVKVPGGFATTAQAFRDFLTHNRLTERINERLARLNTDNEEMDLLVKTLQEETDKLSFNFLIPFDFYRVSQFDLEKHIVRVSCPMVYNQLFAFAIIKKEFDYPKSMLIY